MTMILEIVLAGKGGEPPSIRDLAAADDFPDDIREIGDRIAELRPTELKELQKYVHSVVNR